MTELSFKLEVFEGPLDLLLHLISKHKLNINDIPIAELVNQYLDAIGRMAEQDMEIAGEFLEMAARLIYMKTVSLLPSREEAETLKKELQGRLIEYSVCKEAAQKLREQYIGGDIFIRRPLSVEADPIYRRVHSPEELLKCYQGISVKENERKPVSASVFSRIVSRKFVSVTTKILYVLQKLYTAGKVRVDGLLEGMRDRSERVATFLAVLELTKSGRILISEDNMEIVFNRSFTLPEGPLESQFDKQEAETDSESKGEDRIQQDPALDREGGP